MSTQLPEIWDQEDDWTKQASPEERRRRQNRLNQRAYRKRRHQKRLELVKAPESSPKKTDAPKAVLDREEHVDPRGHQAVNQLLSGDSAVSFLLKHYKSPAIHKYVMEFLHNAAIHFSLKLPNPRDLPGLSRLNALDALIRNTMTLRIPFAFLETDEYNSLFNLYGPQLPDVDENFPPDLCPTALQVSVVHHPWLDVLPFPGFRDNILKGIKSGQFDDTELCEDICCSLLDLAAQSTSNMLIWGEAWDGNGWEFSPEFFHKWGFLLRGCPEILQRTNYWREQRGEQRIEYLTD